MKKISLVASLAVMTTSVLEASFIDINRSNSNRSSTQHRILGLSLEASFIDTNRSNSSRSSTQHQILGLSSDFQSKCDSNFDSKSTFQSQLLRIVFMKNEKILALLRKEHEDLNEKIKKENKDVLKTLLDKRLDLIKELMKCLKKDQIEDIINSKMSVTDVLGQEDVNIDPNVSTALFFLACKDENYEIVRLLLALKNVNDKFVNINVGFPLHAVCKKGHIEIIKLLLNQKDILVNEKDKDGYTPLHLACLKKNYEIIPLLIDKGAVVDDNLSKLIKSDATIRRIINRAKGLNSQSDKNKKVKKQPSKKLPKKVLINNVKQNQKEQKRDNREQNGKHSNSDVLTKEVPESIKADFFESINGDNLYQIKILLKATPQLINETNKLRRTPLVAALAEKKFDIVKFLLTQKEINLTSKDIYGNSALMYAAKNKYPAIVEDILKKISTPSEHILEQNNEGKDSLGLAMLKPSEFSKLKTEQKSKVIKNRKKVMELLLNHLSSEEKSEEMFFAIKNNLWDMAEIILNSGVDINKKDGSTPPLILALKTKERDDKEKKLAFIKALIANKDIRLDAEDENECTALSYAVDNQYWEIVELLIGEKVKISFKLVEEIKDQMVLDQIIQLDLKPYIEKKSELAIKDNNEEQVNDEQKQERYKLKFMNSSLKTYNGSNFDKNIKEGIDDIIKSLKIDPYKIANESLAGNYGLTNFGNNGYVRLYSAHPNSTKGGRVAYVVIEKLKEVWIIEANNKHYNFMKKHTRLKDILNGIFVDFDLEDNKKKALDDHLTENDATVIDMSSDEEDIDLFDSSITYQTRDIAQYLIEHDISANEYVRFLQNIMDQIKKK